MRQTKCWFAAIGTLVTLAMALMLPSGSVAASPSKLLYKFKGGDDGGFPFAGLIFDSAKNLYGTTISGGGGTACSSGCGTVFKLKPNSNGGWTESVLYSFAGGADGSWPLARLILDSAGNLYGTTSEGGGSKNCNGGCGTVFETTANSDGSWTETVLYRFIGLSDGASPWAGVIFDKAGNLYGTTRNGGSSGFGTVFKLTKNADGSWTESVLYSFCSLTACADGGQPVSSLIFNATGDLYGTNSGGGGPSGGGTIFKMTANSDGTWTENVLYNFCSLSSCRDGSGPTADLIFDKAGNLYSTTGAGGFQNGVVFKLKKHSDGKWAESVLYRFQKGSGIQPYAGLTFNSEGTLYGTTIVGGPGNNGVVFGLAPQPGGVWTFGLVHAFTRNGAQTPYGGLVLDKAGNIYGTAEHCGGTTQCQGAVFEIIP